MTENTTPVQVSENVFGKLPELVLISGVAELSNEKLPDVGAIKAYLNESWEKLKQNVANEGSAESVRVQQWIDALKAAGVHVKDFPPSIKAIVKRALKGGEPFSINPVVDTYNAISMELALPLGAYDLGQLKGGLQLRLSQGAENFIALGSSENDPTLPDEIVYSDRENILTRMFLWRQSNKGKITTDTKKFVFVCELLTSMEPNLQTQAQDLIVQKMESLLGANVSNVTVQTKT
jgi:DNA/RNA-binding domain of Phe-tRNA-synthetase-like protein